jgi:hypothetical protein
MVENNQKRAVGTLSKRETAEQALNELKASGFSMDKVSIIAKDAEQGDRIGGAEMSDRIGNKDVQTPTGVVADTLTGATWGSILVGLGSLAIPGIGPIIAAGSVGAALIAGVAGTGIGAAATGALVKALTDIGIPEAEAGVYSDRLIGGNYLVILDGTDSEISHAEAILSKQGIQDWGVYSSNLAEG